MWAAIESLLWHPVFSGFLGALLGALITAVVSRKIAFESIRRHFIEEDRRHQMSMIAELSEIASWIREVKGGRRLEYLIEFMRCATRNTSFLSSPFAIQVQKFNKQCAYGAQNAQYIGDVPRFDEAANFVAACEAELQRLKNCCITPNC